MFDIISAEVLSTILDKFDPLDPAWAAIMRLNKYIREVAMTTRGLMPVSFAQVAQHGERAVDYFIDLIDRNDPERPCVGAIMYFAPCALDLSARHYRALMQHVTIGFDTFTDVVMRRPDLALIAWEGCVEWPCVVAQCASGSGIERCETSCPARPADWRAQNLNRWMRECDGQLYMNFDAARVHVDECLQATDRTAAFRSADAGLVRCYLFNAVSDGNHVYLAALLLYSAIVGHNFATVGEFLAMYNAAMKKPSITRNIIIDDAFLSVLMNWAVLRGSADCVAVINEIIRRDGTAELARTLGLGDNSPVFPRYSREWLTGGAVEQVMSHHNMIGSFTADGCRAALDAPITSATRGNIDHVITSINYI